MIFQDKLAENRPIDRTFHKCRPSDPTQPATLDYPLKISSTGTEIYFLKKNKKVDYKDKRTHITFLGNRFKKFKIPYCPHFSITPPNEAIEVPI